jgi:hypothetical protein
MRAPAVHRQTRPGLRRVMRRTYGRNHLGSGRRDLARPALDQPRRQDHAPGRALIPVQPREDQLGRLAADAGGVLGDDGDARLEHVGEWDVVEPDERDRSMDAELVERLERSERDQVLRGEQRGGWILPLEESARARLDAAGAERRVVDEPWVLADAVLRERLAVSPQPLCRGEDLRLIAEEGDPAVAAGDEVRDGRSSAPDVVAEDRVSVEELRRAVDEDQTDPGGGVARAAPRSALAPGPAARRSCRRT